LFVNSNSDVDADTKFYKEGELDARLDTFAFKGVEGDITGPYFDAGAFKATKITKIADLADSVNARHILVKQENAMVLSDSLIELLNNGADFASLANEFSEDPGSAEKGGDLGWFKEGMMVKPFNDTCFFGEKGKIYKVFSQFGIHIVQIIDKGAASKKSATFYNCYQC
jgi:peptidyl-prolyl cis-trans isomerase D